LSSTLPITVFAFVFTLGLVIIVHELGHFLFCKLFGIYVKTFSIGIGPKILRKRIGETEYVLSAIPFGGYVKMAGEGIMEEIQDTGTWEERKYPLGTEEGNLEAAAVDLHIPPERHLNNRPAYQRLAVFVAGPIFNLLLAFLLYAGVLLHDGLEVIPITVLGRIEPDSPAAAAGLAVGDQILTVDDEKVVLWYDLVSRLVEPSLDQPETPQPVPLSFLRSGWIHEIELTPRFDAERRGWTVGLEPWNTTVGLVQREGPAHRIGLREGDRILTLNENQVTSFSDIARIINRSGGEEVRIRYQRDGQELAAVVVPKLAKVQGDTLIGRIFFQPHTLQRPVGLGRALEASFRTTWRSMTVTLGVLRQFVARKLGLEAVGGPLRIGQLAGEMLRWSFTYLLQFIAFFSVNLFLLNLLPIPVLDGGHVVFLFVEVVTRRRVPERVQAIATQVGLIILLLFMTFVVVVDVLKVAGQ